MKPISKGRVLGQSMVEFALVLPLFLLILFALIDVARFVYTSNALSNMAREAARVSAVEFRPDCAQATRDLCADAIARTRITAVTLKPGLATSGLASAVGVYVECRAQTNLAVVALASCRSNDILKVRLNADFNVVTPIMSSLVQSLPISGEAQVTVN